MARPSWSGFLRFNLISIPVKGYTATAPGGGKIGFHLIHTSCHSRIRYKKVCPIHGEVPNDEIVSGYEAAKGQFVTVEKDERTALKAEDEKTIGIDAFIPPEAIDPIYFSGRSYFLVPDGKVAQKPYSVFHDAMKAEGRYAIAQVVFAGRAQVAVVRPSGGVLSMTLLNYESQMKKPEDFEDEVSGGAPAAEERKLAETLIEAATAKEFELGEYKDEYNAKLARLVEGKSRRKKPSRAAHDGEPAVINLMDALRKSLVQAGRSHNGKHHRNGKASRRHHARRKTG
ncbi:MAG TPA: Ku protein [Gemmata sp.]|nr:Ku protein [Gemmata sp.]